MQINLSKSITTKAAPKLLVVSPNQNMGARRQRLLMAAGYDATTLHSADKALSLLKTNAYEALILGQMLSYLDKRRLIEQSRKSATPVIVLHVLPWDDSPKTTDTVRVTEGAEGLLRAIKNVIAEKK